MVKVRLHKLILSLGLMLCAGLMNQPSIAAKSELQTVNDLGYGEALYHYFQEKYFSAITDLLIASERRPIHDQADAPELLLGGLYLSYGLSHDASRIFDRLIDANVTEEIRDRAWFYLAKLQYQRGHTDEAGLALSHIGNTLPEEREAERLNLQANVYLRQKKYPQAIALLKDFEHDSTWKYYAQFNLGVALVKSGKWQEGAKLLEELGKAKPHNPEERALRDKANLAQGYTYIRHGQPDQAIATLERIRLNGPLSNKALLGIGWAYSIKEEHQASLVPWLELKDRSSLDSAVQEALLSIPYTLEKLEKQKLALTSYTTAINTYNAELLQINKMLAAIESGELINAMRPADVSDELGIPTILYDMPDSVTTPYLNQLMATNEFQEGYKNFRDLLYMQYVINHWDIQLPAYVLMLKERRKGYNDKLPRITEDERINRLAMLQKKRNSLATRIVQIEQSQDTLALATTDELLMLKRLHKINQRLTRLAAHEDLSEQQEKYRLFHGLLFWEISRDYNARLWQVKNGLQQVDKALTETHATRQSLLASWKQAPLNFTNFDKRIRTTDSRLQALRKKMAATLQAYENYIQALAIRALQKRKQQLENYRIRARFSMARLYDALTKDSMSKAATERPEQVSPGQKTKPLETPQPAPDTPVQEQATESKP